MSYNYIYTLFWLESAIRHKGIEDGKSLVGSFIVILDYFTKRVAKKSATALLSLK